MKVASFESLEFLFSKKRDSYNVLHVPNSPCHTLTHANYSPDKIVNISIPAARKKTAIELFKFFSNEKKLIKTTNLTKLIHQYNIKNIMPDTYSSYFLEKWSHKENLHLIVPLYVLQKKLENKIFFDTFLRKHNLPVPQGVILRTEEDFKKINFFPVIIQVPDSKGSAGTFLAKNTEEIKKLFDSHKDVKFPLLCRKFIDQGLTLGVSIIMGEKNMIFSALRAQAHFLQPNGRSVYYGIQWLKTNTFSPHVIEKINQMIQIAGEKIQLMGYRGMLSFDLLIKGDSVYFIECNPRTGGASAQMSANPSLIHGEILTKELILASCGKDLSTHKPFIPENKYEGFTLDIGFLADIFPRGKSLCTIKSGIYIFQGRKLEYVSPNIKLFEKQNHLFIYYNRPNKSRLTQKAFMGFLLAHFPLLKITGQTYSLSEEAESLTQNLKNLILKK